MRLNLRKRMASFKAVRRERKARRATLAAGIREVFGRPASSWYELERQANFLAHQGGEISAWRRAALRSQFLDSLLEIRLFAGPDRVAIEVLNERIGEVIEGVLGVLGVG